MSNYNAPLNEVNFLLNEVLDLNSIAQLPGYEEATPDLVDSILAEAGRYFSEVVAPTNKIADSQGTSLGDKAVITAPALDAVYTSYREAGWPALCGDPAYGGQGMPHVVGVAVEEMLQSANLAFSLMPLLTQGVITALGRFGSEQQKALYLPRLISGEWAGTMNLTEPQAGSDLAAVRAKAVPHGDHYLLSGQKIFITWGDQSYTDNIIHMVLARTPDAPEGVKGISLFIVPKFQTDEQGHIGERNDVYPVGVEHKLGIHASPTCTLSYGDNGGAVAYLVGEENQGLMYMFSMMNHARLAVGLQGVAISERAYQQAHAYARERLQGTAPGVEGRAAIIEHPDVRRMLLLMKSQTEAARALAYAAMAHYDQATHGADEATRAYHQRRADILTPLVKGWCTELSNEVTSLAVQVYGGMGYIEETGVAQYMRDARILAIYEGTNGIQAMDLVGRKVLANKGQYAEELLADLLPVVDQCRQQQLGAIADTLAKALAACQEAVVEIFANAPKDPHYPGSVAFNLMMLMGTATAGALMAKGAAIAAAKLAAGEGNQAFNQTKLNTVKFYMDQVMPRTGMYLQIIKNGHESVMGAIE